jgi:murein DD-endopeptidase MepM/ murein hydrolase activator NlpD
MDRQTAAKMRYDRLKKAIADDTRVRKRARRNRVIGLLILGAWVVIPTAFWTVDMEDVGRPEFFRTPTPHEAYLLELARAGGGAEAERGAAERDAAERGAAERGAAEGGAAERDAAERGTAERGASERGTAERPAPERGAREREWETVANQAVTSPLAVGAAYREVGLFPLGEPQALGLRIHVPEGQRLRVEVDREGEAFSELFVDLFRAAPPDFERGGEAGANGESGAGPERIPRPAFVIGDLLTGGRWSYDARRAADYVLRLQPRLEDGGQYQVTVRVGAPWDFPVAGAGEEDIGGVFGDPRDGGRREHRGVDIFKPRGTPVLAAADGRVTAVDTTDIGGRVVWQREAGGNHSLYYAHLERPLVRDGQQLRAGDTVGLIGNTGNARTTPPHLHFGAYRRGRGAVDPWNLILPVPPEVTEVVVDLDLLGEEARVSGNGVTLRASPSQEGAILATLSAEGPFRILAGVAGWYRVLLPGGQSGFIGSQDAVIVEPEGTRRADRQ